MTLADLDAVEARFADEDGVGTYQWFGFSRLVAERRRFDETRLLGPEGGTLAVVDPAGGFAGLVRWSEAFWGPANCSSCWSIAIGLFPEYRGVGIGTDAHELLVSYLFAHTRAQRIQAWTDVENLVEQRALERAGFEREGVLREAQWRAGGWHDQLLYSRIRTTSATK